MTTTTSSFTIAALATLLLAAPGCQRRDAGQAGQDEPATPAAPTAPAEGTQPAPDIADREPVAGQDTDVPQLQSLRQAAQRLGQRPDQQTVVQAVRSLADALDSLPVESAALTQAASSIRTQSSLLEQAGPQVTTENSTWAKSTLSLAVVSLESLQQQHQIPGLQDPLAAARESVEGLDPARGLEAQKGEISDAFNKVAEALRVIHQSRPAQPTAP